MPQIPRDAIGQGTPEHRFIQRIRGLESRLADLEEDRTSDEAVNIIRRLDDIHLAADALTISEYTPGILADNDANGTADFGTVAGGVLRFDVGSPTPATATPALAPTDTVAVYDDPGSTTLAEAFVFTAPTATGATILESPAAVAVAATPSVADALEVIAQDGASALTASATPAPAPASTPPVTDAASSTLAAAPTSPAAETTSVVATDGASTTAPTATPTPAAETVGVGFGRLAWDTDEWGSPSG